MRFVSFRFKQPATSSSSGTAVFRRDRLCGTRHHRGKNTKDPGEHTAAWSRAVLRELRDEIRRADPNRWGMDDDREPAGHWQYQGSKMSSLRGVDV